MVANLIAHFTKFDKYRKSDQPLKDALAALQAKFATADPPLQDALTALAAKTSTLNRTPTKAAPKPGPPSPCWIRTPKRLTQPLSPSPPSPSRCRQKAIGHAIQSVIVKK
jgi:hypothetical protein